MIFQYHFLCNLQGAFYADPTPKIFLMILFLRNSFHCIFIYKDKKVLRGSPSAVAEFQWASHLQVIKLQT